MDEPDRQAAEKDNHETELVRGRCTPTDPCPSCRWALKQRYR